MLLHSRYRIANNKLYNLAKFGPIESAFALPIAGPIRENMACCLEHHRDLFAQLHLHELSFARSSKFTAVFNMATATF